MKIRMVVTVDVPTVAWAHLNEGPWGDGLLLSHAVKTDVKSHVLNQLQGSEMFKKLDVKVEVQ